MAPDSRLCYTPVGGRLQWIDGGRDAVHTGGSAMTRDPRDEIAMPVLSDAELQDI